MSRTPRISTEILDVSVNMNTGELTIAGLRFRPCGPGSGENDVARDDGMAAYHAICEVRDECFDWRIYADALETHLRRQPSMPHHGKPR